MTKIIILIAVLVLSSCGKISEKTPKQENKEIKKEDGPDKDTPGYSKNHHTVITYDLKDDEAVIEAGSDMAWIFGKDYKSWAPSNEDIGNAEKMIKKCFEDQKMGTVNRVLNRKPEDYCKQFIGAVNSNGERILWINMFCKSEISHFKNWKTDIIHVADGGNCFVQIKFNWDKNDGHYEFKVNGDA